MKSLPAAPLVTATKDMTVRDACRLMVEKKIGAVLVVEKARIAGIFDRARRLDQGARRVARPDKTTVAKVMVAISRPSAPPSPLAYAST